MFRQACELIITVVLKEFAFQPLLPHQLCDLALIVSPLLLTWFNFPLLVIRLDCCSSDSENWWHGCIIHKPEQLHIWSFLPQSLSTFSFPLSLCLFLSVSLKLFDMQMTKSACLKTTRGRVSTQEQVVCFDFLNYDSDDEITILWFSFHDVFFIVLASCLRN